MIRIRMSKLTLSVDKAVVARAKRYARERNLSLSKIVETYLAEVAEPTAVSSEPPILRSMRGVLKKADVKDYKNHLARKYT